MAPKAPWISEPASWGVGAVGVPVTVISALQKKRSASAALAAVSAPSLGRPALPSTLPRTRSLSFETADLSCPLVCPQVGDLLLATINNSCAAHFCVAQST